MARFVALLLIVHASVALRAQDHVVLLIIDGARYSETLGDTLALFTPTMHAIARQGAVVDTFLNDGATYTSRAIPAIWCGSWSVPQDTVIGGTTSTQYATVPTVWEYYRRSTGAAETQAVYVLKDLSNPWLPSFFPDYGQAYWPMYVTEGSTDFDVWNRARTLLEDHHPQLSVIYLADVDHAGHSGVWDNYTTAIRNADSIVGLVWNYLQSDSIFRNTTTLLVTNDHGRHSDGVSTGFRGHGCSCWGCRHIALLGIGKAVKSSLRYKGRQSIIDIAPTIGRILGFPTPFADGSVMDSILADQASSTDSAMGPAGFNLHQNYPNPFNPRTTIEYVIDKSEHTRLNVYDLLGREVAVLVNEERPAGSHNVAFDASGLPSGVYLCRLQTGNSALTKKLILLR